MSGVIPDVAFNTALIANPDELPTTTGVPLLAIKLTVSVVPVGIVLMSIALYGMFIQYRIVKTK